MLRQLLSQNPRSLSTDLSSQSISRNVQNVISDSPPSSSAFSSFTAQQIFPQIVTNSGSTNEVIITSEEGGKSLAVLSNVPTISSPAYNNDVDAMEPAILTYPYNDGHTVGTPELFSSSYAMLSEDHDTSNAGVKWDFHNESGKELPVVQGFYACNDEAIPVNEYNQSVVQHPLQALQQELSCDVQPTVGQVLYSQLSQGLIQPSSRFKNLSKPKSRDSRKHRPTGLGKAGRFTQSAYSNAFKEMAQIPVNEDGTEVRGELSSGAGNEGSQRVMCVACRTIYPSKRSLTGHIGRNEKCREIIGRTYLSQVCRPLEKLTSSASPELSQQAEVISPICPYCDRFISHYKGNIRRHVNQCCKAHGGIMKASPNSDRKDEFISPSTTSQYAVGSDTPCSSGTNSNDGCSSGVADYASNSMMNDNLRWTQDIPQFRVVFPSNKKTNEDPYICSMCSFITIYKGNMKRHLHTCHSKTEKDLPEGGFDSLRMSNYAKDGRQGELEKLMRERRSRSFQDNQTNHLCAPLEQRSTSDISANNQSSSSPERVDSSYVQSGQSQFMTVSQCCSSTYRPSSADSKPLANGASDSEPLEIHQTGSYSSPASMERNFPEQPAPQQNGHSVDSCLTKGSGNRQSSINKLANGTSALSPSNDHKGETHASNHADIAFVEHSKVDEIIDAVAANQLGGTFMESAKKRKSRTVTSGKSHSPKIACSIDTVRDYWEAERRNLGIHDAGPICYGRSRAAQFAAVTNIFSMKSSSEVRPSL
ncbi:hypothetical protein AB6A40_003301 [Gnathostoma spinigerum]|uniref:C2H2-type domain-containing protein n=1 Tax=Gnathostoma spinigerum TaxID=75299 RepID=A0ABD6EIV1_9BILA